MKVRALAPFRAPTPFDEELAFVLFPAVDDAVGLTNVTELEGVDELVCER